MPDYVPLTQADVTAIKAALADLKTVKEFVDAAALEDGREAPTQAKKDKRPKLLPRPVLILKVTSNASGGGKYYGKLIGPSPAVNTVSASGDLSEDDLGTLSDSEDVAFENLAEVGLSTHVLTEGGQTPYAIGQLLGYSDETPPKRIVRGGPGGGIKKPTAKYQVYTPIDDTLDPIWAPMRVQE